MKLFQPLILLAALLLALHTTPAQAVITHYNVDDFTLPGGPMEISFVSESAFSGGQKIYSLLATNNGLTPLIDVRYLLTFVQENLLPAHGSAYSFNDATDTWTLGPNALNWQTSGILLQGANGFDMNNTDAPSSFPTYGTLPANSTVPQVLLGNLGPGASFPFAITANLSSNFAFYSLGSAVAAVPEPSSIALLAIAAFAVVAVRRAGKK